MICASCGGMVEGDQWDEARDGACPKCEGAVLLGTELRYRLLSILGRGANGITYRAERTSDGALFAIKEMPLRTLESTKAMELFDREARVLRELDHPAIPKYEDDFLFGEGKSSALFLVQELVEGQSLDEEAKTKRYTEAEVFAIVAEIAEVLDYLHRKSPPVVHRDVKPKNVMRRARDRKLVLIDFGSVRDALSVGGGSTVAGTFGYMAPEQLAGKATPASDVYALGALAVALLARKEPDTLLGEDHTVDVRANVAVSAGALELLEDLLARDPKARPQRGRDVVERARALGRASAPPKPKPKAREQAKPKAREQAKPSGPATARAPKSNKDARSVSRGSRAERKLRQSEEREAARLKKVGRAEERESAQVLERDRDRERQREKKRERDADASESTPMAPERETRASKLLRATNRGMVLAVGCAFALCGVVVWYSGFYRPSVRLQALAMSAVGPPEIYARPIAVDVNGDGVEDLVMVTGVDSGPRLEEDESVDRQHEEHGHWVDHVQAIDGKDGRVLYVIKVGEAFASGGNNAMAVERVALIATKTRLGVARLTFSSTTPTKIDVHDLASGNKLESFTIEASTGEVCVNDKGRFVFDRAGGVTAVNLDAARVEPADTARCSLATANVADVPAPFDTMHAITSRTKWPARFSLSSPFRASPFKGDEVVTSGGIGVLVHDNTPAAAKEEAPSLPTITIDNGIGASPSRARVIDLVGIDLATNETRFHRSLASLGFTSQKIDHLEGTPDGTLVFFDGAGGVALIDGTGARKWALALPKEDRISSYTLSKTRLYLHVFGYARNSIYSNLSKQLASRILVVDLATGTYLTSLPAGSLVPDTPPPAKSAVMDMSVFKGVKGCTCRMMADGSPVPTKIDWAEMGFDDRKKAMIADEIKEATKRTDGSKEEIARVTKRVIEARMRGTLLDGGAPQELNLQMAVGSSVESGGRKRFRILYALAVDGQSFVLPHYEEQRDLSPPGVLEGDVALSIACSRGVLVVAHDRVATAWSIASRDELWTTELPASIGATKTTLGGGATLSCAVGSVEGDHVRLPVAGMAGKGMVVSLKDGRAVTKDAGR